VYVLVVKQFDSLDIQDIEIKEEPSAYQINLANKLLAGWLIQHWIKKTKTRKTLIFKKRAVCYGQKQAGAKP